MNRLLRMLLGTGQVPPDLRAAVVAENPVLLEEGLVGSVTLRRFRSGRSLGSQSGSGRYEKRGVSGAIAITPVRLVVWAGRFKHVDVPLNHPMLAEIEVRSDRPGQVTFGYDAGNTNPSRPARSRYGCAPTRRPGSSNSSPADAESALPPGSGIVRDLAEIYPVRRRPESPRVGCNADCSVNPEAGRRWAAVGPSGSSTAKEIRSMRQYARIAIRGAVVLMVAGQLAACSGGSDTPAAPATPTTPPSTSTSTAPSTTAATPAPTPTTPAATPAPTPTPKPATGTALRTGLLRGFPNALSDSRGRAVYIFSTDRNGRATCLDACARPWPPVLTTGTPTISGPGSNPRSAGTQPRGDGTTQATYASWPLYYFINDRSPGQATGVGRNVFGGQFRLINGNGNMIMSR